ncbi:MAG TPA: VTT domain-containing protein [Burkholderiales bacterium]|nr:VTT domain-containing protein [Burkholderiales bacterium]
MPKSTSRRGKRRPAWGKLGLILLGAAALAAVWRWTPLAEIVTAERIVGWTRTVRETWWAPIVLILAYVPAAFVLLPRPLITLVSVMTFGVLWGLVYATSGVLSAALVTYYAGRLLPEETLRRLAGDALESVGKLLREHGIVAVFGSNMLPTPPFVVQNMIAGAVSIPLWKFVLGTFLSLLPAMLAWTVFGDQINAALEDSSKVSWWLIGGALVLLVGFTLVARHFLAKRFQSA